MSFQQEKQAAHKILSAIEDGNLKVAETFYLIEEADPTLVYFIFSWIRAWYPSSHPAADGVLGRMSELVTQYPKAARMVKQGESDSLVGWFEDEYSYRDLRADAFIDLIVDKLEG